MRQSIAKTATLKIYGNCDMCKETIEKAGNIKKLAKVDWDTATKMATLTYDAQKTTQDAILKRIALAGYDSETFLAPDDVYSKLPECCQYKREAKNALKEIVVEKQANHSAAAKVEKEDLSDKIQEKQTDQLKTVFDHYFAVKDALVKTDGNVASIKAKDLLKSIDVVKMNQLEDNVHTVWMKVLNDLKEHTAHIADTKDIKHQRDHFMDLSKSMYELFKVSKQETPIYYQHCPMANDGKGANWFSKESAIKNPYYGSQMLTCGKTVETIK
jgi:copper chaperone CopZ